MSLRVFGAHVFSAYGYGDVGKACACLPVFSGARVYGDLLYGYGDVGKGLLLRGPGAQRELRALVRGYALWARIARFSPWSWCSALLRGVCAAMSCCGGSFNPDGTYDSVWVCVWPLVGNALGCVCMLNGWFSNYDDICADNFLFPGSG